MRTEIATSGQYWRSKRAIAYGQFHGDSHYILEILGPLLMP